MSDDGGWTRSYRRKWRNPVFLNFRDAAVWSYLIDNAAWADGTEIRFEGRLVTLRAGQIAVSERFLATGFSCDRQVIRRIFAALEKNLMATREQAHGTTILTICNYKQYQNKEQAENPPEISDQTQAEPSSNPNNKNTKNLRTKKIPSESIDRSPDNVFEEWWALYPEKIGKQAAKPLFLRALKTVPAEKLFAALDLYKRTKPADRAWAHARTWLYQARWDDEPSGTPAIATSKPAYGSKPQEVFRTPDSPPSEDIPESERLPQTEARRLFAEARQGLLDATAGKTKTLKYGGMLR